jgi:hypothetical protein
MSRFNTAGVFYGQNANTEYDKCAYNDFLSESVSPLLYRLNENNISNCNSCLSVFGPRPNQGPRSQGVSTLAKPNSSAPSQQLVDVESVLSNRNVLQGKCKDSKLNKINVTKFKLQHARTCNDFLDPVSTHLTHPSYNYKGLAVNRFYDLDRNPQQNIYYDHQINTRLEAKDNYRERIPQLIDDDPVLPRPEKGYNPSYWKLNGCSDC